MLKSLELLVADIRDVTATKVLRVINLDEHTVSYTPSCSTFPMDKGTDSYIQTLVSPVVNTIEISKNDTCLIVLTSEQAVETVIVSLRSGSLLRRYSTKTPLESRKQASGAIYHVQHNTDFARDAQYQVRNQTHKDCPPAQSLSRWLRVPAETGDGDECITGSYEHTPEPTFPCPLARHSVTFAKQGVTFTALTEPYDGRNVNRICLRISTGNIGVEKQDSDVTEANHALPHQREIGSPAGRATTEVNWTHRARMSAPRDCIRINNETGEYIDTREWCRQRSAWPAHTILLGDEKALVLVLPHQLVVWRFETRQMYADRLKKKLKRLVLEGLLQIVLIPGYLAAAVGAVPLIFTVVAWNVCSHFHKKMKRSETLRKMRRKDG